jgi:hypothetical protein
LDIVVKVIMPCKILHTLYNGIPVCVEILHTLVYGLCWTASSTSPSITPLWLVFCTCSREGTIICHTSVYMWFGKHCHYCARAVLPFPLLNLYMKDISAYSSCVNVKGISLSFAQQETTASVEYNNWTENKCVTVVLVCYCTIALNSVMMMMNQTFVYRTCFASRICENMLLKLGQYMLGHLAYWVLWHFDVR